MLVKLCVRCKDKPVSGNTLKYKYCTDCREKKFREYESQKRYVENNRAKVNANKCLSYRRHIEARRAQAREYYQKRKLQPEHKEYVKMYYQKHKEKITARSRAYYHAHKRLKHDT